MPSDWFRSLCRWGALRVHESEIHSVDAASWAEVWRALDLDGVTLHAGGDAALYPTRVAGHRRALGLAGRDLFGELVARARDAGLRILAGIDLTHAAADVYYARSDSFFLGADGAPRRSADGSFLACINTPHFWHVGVEIFAEIMERYRVDGFWAESWPGYGFAPPGEPCHCAACREKYRLQRDAEIPVNVDPSLPEYRRWLDWRHDCAAELWTHWNDTVKLFSRDSVFVASPTPGGLPADLAAVPAFDSSRRPWTAGVVARQLRALSPDAGHIVTVDAAPPYTPGGLDAALRGVAAAGAVPCVRFPRAMGFDRRFVDAAAAAMRESTPPALPGAATVSVLLSERSIRYQGRPAEEALLGAAAALVRAGIPFDLISASGLTRKSLSPYRAVVLPNVGCLDGDTCDILWEFGSDGGGLVATFETSVYDESGAPRGDFGMTDRLGVKLMRAAPIDLPESGWLRTHSHEALSEFRATPLLPAGGRMLCVEMLMDHRTAVTIVPPGGENLPAGEEAPAMLLGPSGRGRVVYFPAELDAEYFRTGRPDHAGLIEAAARWAARDPMPYRLEGARWVDLSIEPHDDGVTVHLVASSPQAIDGSVTVPACALHVTIGTVSSACIAGTESKLKSTAFEGETVIEIPAFTGSLSVRLVHAKA